MTVPTSPIWVACVTHHRAVVSRRWRIIVGIGSAERSGGGKAARRARDHFCLCHLRWVAAGCSLAGTRLDPTLLQHFLPATVIHPAKLSVRLHGQLLRSYVLTLHPSRLHMSSSPPTSLDMCSLQEEHSGAGSSDSSHLEEQLADVEALLDQLKAQERASQATTRALQVQQEVILSNGLGYA